MFRKDQHRSRRSRRSRLNFGMLFGGAVAIAAVVFVFGLLVRAAVAPMVGG
jgi:hypothetical protein